jgi:hypothetical protein
MRVRDPEFWLLLGTLMAASCAAYYTRQQWLTATDNEKRSLRAYIILTDVGIFCPDCGDTALIPQALPEIRNSIRLRIENNGQTPAYNVSSVTNWTAVPDVSPDARLPERYSFPDPKPPSDHFVSTSDIGRDKHTDSVGPIPDDQIAVFRNAGAKRSTLFIYGHIDYCDIFNEPHSTAFCFKYFQNAGSLPICDRYNGEIAPQHKC